MTKTKLIALRVPIEVYNLLIKSTKINNLTLTNIVLKCIENNIVKNNVLDNTLLFLSEQEKLMVDAIRDERLARLGNNVQVFERDHYKCRKCCSTNNIIEVPVSDELLGKTFAGLDSESKITLCINCFKEMQRFIPKRYRLERFLEWYYN